MARSDANTTRYAVLGMLSAAPRSGYDIKKAIDGSIAHFWSESFGQIYPILRQLAADGLVVRRHETQRGKPDRHVYSITRRGRERLRAWLATPPRAETFRSELLLKLFLGRLVPRSVTRAHLAQFHERQDALLRTYAQIERSLRREHERDPGLVYWLMTAEYGRRRATALRRWAEETTKALDKAGRVRAKEKRR